MKQVESLRTIAPPPKRTPVERRMPKFSELRELLQFRSPTLDPVTRRLEGALSIDELRRIASQKTPRAVFHYVDGGSDAETTVERNRKAFADLVFVPEALNSVADPDLTTELIGKRISLPLVFAPTGYTRMMHHEGEIAVSRVAARNGFPYALSTVGTSTVEDIRVAAPDGDNWFQLYLTNNMALNEELIDRALAAEFSTVILTVDTAVAGHHLKDIHNGLTIPPALTAKTFLDMSRHPYWWINKLTTPAIGFASLQSLAGAALNAVDVPGTVFEPSLNYEHLDWLRQRWPHRLLVKGILNPLDAKKVVSMGADGVVVSNHGGRQLDRTPATLDVLPDVRAAVGADSTVLIDGGITHGQDIIAALALGADAVMVGRAYLYGLMAGGERGVERVVELLRDDYRRGLQLLGLNATSKIARHHVRLPPAVTVDQQAIGRLVPPASVG